MFNKLLCFWRQLLSNGEWDSAIIKSILYVGIGIAIWSLFTGLAPSSLKDVWGLLVVFFLYIGVYILISIIGWLVIGFPVHWFTTKYTNGSYLYYAALPLIFVIVGLFHHTQLLLGLAALFQAVIFRYYLYKKHNK